MEIKYNINMHWLKGCTLFTLITSRKTCEIVLFVASAKKRFCCGFALFIPRVWPQLANNLIRYLCDQFLILTLLNKVLFYFKKYLKWFCPLFAYLSDLHTLALFLSRFLLIRSLYRFHAHIFANIYWYLKWWLGWLIFMY